MDIPYLITIIQNKLNYLKNAQTAALAVGDINGVNSIDQEILTTQNTLVQLELLQSVTAAAAASSASTAALLGEAIASAQMQGLSASTIINGYDISAYATDPLYEQKLTNILSTMPAFAVTGDIDTYISSIATSSPLTGLMIFDSAQKYSIDLRLLTAMLALESSFGTQGVGASTFNPGNVGNTGSGTHSFGSFAEGVDAVAEWLSRHRADSIIQPGIPSFTPSVIVSVLSMVTISPSSMSLCPSETQPLSVTALDTNGSPTNSDAIIYSSDNPNVATVDNTGLVVGVGLGTATITAQVISGNSAARGFAAVTGIAAESITAPTMTEPELPPVETELAPEPDTTNVEVLSYVPPKRSKRITTVVAKSSRRTSIRG